MTETVNQAVLQEGIKRYLQWSEDHREEHEQALAERVERKAFYQTWTKDRLLLMDEDSFLQFMSKLWALRTWGNKPYAVNHIIERNSLEKLRVELAELVWGDRPISIRWERFRKNISGMGPAQMSEILCHVHPDQFLLWNRRVYEGFLNLEIAETPRYDYQLNGERYQELCKAGRQIRDALIEAGFGNADLLTVDYFIWQELGGKDIHPHSVRRAVAVQEKPLDQAETEKAEFIHNDIRDKLRDIGEWLGFHGETEKKVAKGSQVDTVWEATIGNMGRVIYVFEVQTKGSLDSLILNLLKSLNNPAVQGVVAVSDKEQIEKIKKQAADVKALADKLKYWDYEEVLQIHESLQLVNESINSLGLVPESFL